MIFTKLPLKGAYLINLEKDEDEFGSPRESALKIAIEKLSEELVNQITSTW